MIKALNNWKVVLLSIVGATTFWFFNALNKDYSARLNYPIDWLFDTDSVIIIDPLPKGVLVDVSSGGWNLFRKTLLLFNTPISIQLENPSEIGFYTRSSLMPIVSEKLAGLKINYLITDTLFINIDKKVAKKVAIRIDSMTLPLEDGYRITSSIRIQPDSVVLVGPQMYIDTLRNDYFVYLSDLEIDESFEESIEVYVPDGFFIRSSPDKVDVSFEVAKFNRVTIPVVVEPVNFPEDSSIFLGEYTVDVSFIVEESLIDQYNESDFAVSADLSMLNNNDSSVLAMLMVYPEQLEDLQLEPEHVKIIYESEEPNP